MELVNQEQKYFVSWKKERSSEKAKNFKLNKFEGSAFELTFEKRIGYVKAVMGYTEFTLHKEQGKWKHQSQGRAEHMGK